MAGQYTESKFTKELAVTLLTPIIVPVSGAISTWVAHNAPGVTVKKSDLVYVFLAGAGAALGAILKWLHGRQKVVELGDQVEHVITKVAEAVSSNLPQGPQLDDIEQALRAHADQIVDAIGQKVGAPPSAVDVAQQVVELLVPGVVKAKAAETAAASQPSAPPAVVT